MMICNSNDKNGKCMAQATVEVFWPGQTTVACNYHAQGIMRVAEAMGFHVDIRPIGHPVNQPEGFTPYDTSGSRGEPETLA